eukprot:COSAG04_NODE_19877_length_406_cov_0.690554_1_plen_77_part_10
MPPTKRRGRYRHAMPAIDENSMGILTGMSQVEQRQLSQRLEQEMREMAAASSSEQKHHQEEARAAVAGAAAELKALE